MTIGKKVVLVEVYDQQIVKAYADAERPNHTDAPTEVEIARIRSLLPCAEPEVISLYWLRNRIVQLRKAGLLPKQ